MIVVGAHYMPFMSMYGMWQYGVLAAALLAGGFLLGLLMPHEFALGGWLGGAAMLLFGGAAGVIARRERPAPAAPQP
jgi:hypothetical protein